MTHPNHSGTSALAKSPVLWLLTAALTACGGGGTPAPGGASGANKLPEIAVRGDDGRALNAEAYIASGQSLTLNVSDLDGSVKKVSYVIDRGTPGERGGELTPAGKMTLTLPALGGGAHTLNVSATDNAGGVGTAQADFRVDAAAPTITGMTLNEAALTPGTSTNLTAGDAVTVTATGQDTRGDASETAGPVTLRLLEGTQVRASSASGSLSADLSKKADGSARTAGAVTFTVEAQDSVGFKTSRNFTLNFTAAGTEDVSKPAFTWLTPSSEFVPGNGSTVTLRATATRNDTDLSAGITYTATCGTVSGNVWSLNSSCADGSKQTVTATVSVSGKVYSDTRTVTVDASAPTVQITTPNTGTVNSTNPVKVSLSATDAVSGVASVLLEASSDGGKNFEQVGVLTTATGEVTWAPANGTYTLRATATDRTGLKNVTTVGEIRVQLTSSDKTAPVVSAVQVVNPAEVERGTVTVQATATDADSGVAKVELFDGGTSLGVQTTGVGGTYTFTVDTTKLSDGLHTLRAVATDNVGLSHERTLTLQVDNTRPVVSWLSPTDGGVVGGTVTLNATTDEGSVSYAVDGTPVQGNTYTFAKDGLHTITATATDRAKNTTTATIKVTSDATAPAVQITSPASNQSFTQAPVTISVQAQDQGSGLKSVTVYAQAEGKAEEELGSPSAAGTLVWYPQTTDGTPYTLRAVATDQAGNSRTSALVSGVRVQTVSQIKPSLIAIESPAAAPQGKKVTREGRDYVRGFLDVQASANTTAQGGFRQVELLIDGEVVATETPGASSTSLKPTFTFDFDRVNDGLRDVAVRFTDVLGTVSAPKVSVYVDRNAPVIAWNRPARGAVTHQPVALEATASDTASGVKGTVTYSVNGESITTPQAWTPEKDDTYTVIARAEDNVGNVGTQTTSLTYDATAPVITATSPADTQEFSTAPVTLSATATDNLTGVASMEATIHGPGDSAATSLGTQRGNSYSAVFTPVKAGSYTVTFKALDAAGNQAKTVTRSFTYSVTTTPTEKAPAPVLSVVGNGAYTSNMSVNVSGNFDSLSQVDRMILQITDRNGVVDNTSYTATQAQATFSVDTTKLANGEATLQVIAYTKSGLRGISAPTTVTVKNVLNPVLAVAAPADGASVSSPSVPVKVTLTKSGDTTYTFNPATVALELMDYRGQQLEQRNVPCAPSTDGATYTCDTTFDIAGLPADTYTIRATAQVIVEGAIFNPQQLRTESRFTSNTVSVNPPAATISFPTAVTLIGGTRIPARIDSGSGFFATVSDDKAIQYVEARLVGPYAEGNIETDGTRQCQASGSILPGESEVNVLVLNVPGAGNLSYTPQDIFIPKLDVDGSTYVPDSKPGQRYDMRVTTADSEGNRNIQCVPVRVERSLVRPSYAVSNATTPSAPSTTPGELTYTSGTWYLDNVPANSRVAAVFYANGKQVGTNFIAKTTGSRLVVSQTFADVGTYEVKWLIEDMSPTLTASTGVVTTQDGGYINVARNPAPK